MANAVLGGVVIRRGESGGVAGVADLEGDHCPANQGLVVGQVLAQPLNVGHMAPGPKSLLTDVVKDEQPWIARSLFETEERLLVGEAGYPPESAYSIVGRLATESHSS